jgi:glutamate-5-semialdehyde dehydrogenase
MSDATTADRKVETARQAALELQDSPAEARDGALRAIADALEAERESVLAANAEDVAEAEELLSAGEYTRAFVDRLALSATKVESMAEMVRSVADREDPLERTLAARRLNEGLELYRVSVPLGVVGAVFESRPDALVQIAALALKSGNAVVLKGGSEATRSNRRLFELIREAVREFVADGRAAAIPEGWVQLIEAREDVETLLERDDAVDLLAPRGSSAFVEYVQDNTAIPVLGHTEGVCHVYVDREADLDRAVAVTDDAKTQYPAVCNAVETLLVHEAVAPEFLPRVTERLAGKGVEVRGDERTRAVLAEAPATADLAVRAATEEDWSTEYGDLVLAVRVVDSLSAAVGHVNEYGSKHTESILTREEDRARTFMRAVDAASVFHDASTRFADGYRYGLGAEVGISTGKTHARGPVGLAGLTTEKYYLEGEGHLVATYAGEDARPFLHEAFDGAWPPGED